MEIIDMFKKLLSIFVGPSDEQKRQDGYNWAERVYNDLGLYEGYKHVEEHTYGNESDPFDRGALDFVRETKNTFEKAIGYKNEN